jgi:DNA-binding transcriptional MerR regulator/effector-binding domain-containing protein
MFKIGDFSRLAQVSVRMLRHYDKLGLLEPSYTDRFTGYRYYTVDQLPRLNRIVALNDLGLTLAQIAGLLQQDDKLPPEQLRGMLALRQAELARELDEKRWQLARVEMRLQQIEQENDPDPYEIVIKGLESIPVASLRELSPTVYDVGYFCAALYAQLYAELGRLGIAWQGPELTLYHNEEYAETDIDMEVAAPVDAGVVNAADGGALRAGERIELRTLPACDLAAALVYEGPFMGLSRPIQALLRFVGMHGHIPAGPLRELHLSGPAHGEHPNERPVIELQIPIRRL